MVGCGGEKDSGEGLKTPDYVLQDTGEPASEENPQAISGDTFEDYFYSFTMQRPNDGWEFLTEKKAVSVNPGAAMAMASISKRAWVAVIAERSPGTTLEGYGEAIFDPTGALGAGMSPAKSGKVGDLDSLEAESRISLGGTPFRYRITLVQRGDFFYQVLGWSVEFSYEDARSDIESILASFRPVDGREPQRRANLRMENDAGSGWQLVDGVYSNAASGFSLPAPEGCRLMGRAELKNSNRDACLGVTGGFGEFTQVWLTERVGTREGTDLGKYYIDQHSKDLGIEPGERRPVQVGGIDAVEVDFGASQTGGIEIEYKLTLLERDSFYYQIISFWQPFDAAEGKKLLEKCYEGVEWLGDEACKKLAEEIANSDLDPSNSVGSDFAMRNGTFHDFAGGFRFRLPKDGLFDCQTASTSFESLDGSRLVLEDLRAGKFYQIYYIDGDGNNHAAKHAELVQGGNVVVDTSEHTIGQNEFLVTHFTSEGDGLEFSYSTATCAGSDSIFVLSSSQLGKTDVVDDAGLHKILAGLEWPRRFKAFIDGPSTYTDNRLGFKLDASGWEEGTSAVCRIVQSWFFRHVR